MLRQSRDERTLKQNLMLASLTAFAAGVINVAALVSFLAVTADISIGGHMAKLANHMVQQNFEEIAIFFLWLLLFFVGAFASSFTVKSWGNKNTYRAQAIPIVLEIVVLLFVAVYGNHFELETRIQREIVVSCTVFALGLQTGLVAIVSGGLIKSSSLASLFTDLGGECAEYFHVGTKKDKEIRKRIFIRLTVLGFYMLGGAIGGFLFDQYEFAVFYFIPVILLLILL
ncbi:MAG: DUF1275 domain-containing protein [Pedobacter sp.]|nr:MAG: DUF1275 domain-containing protein [Pedobacter sp.]